MNELKAQSFTGKQLATILSALECRPVNPNTKAAAIKRLAAQADELGLKVDDLLDSSAHLLDGRMEPQAWAAAIEKAAREQAEMAKKEPKAAKAARKGKKPAKLVAALEPDSPEIAAEVDAANNRVASREARLAKAKAASKARLAAVPKKAKKVSAIDRLEALLRRPGGATMGTIAQELEWLPKTARAAIAVKIRRERGLLVETVSNREAGQLGTVYRIVD